MDQDPVAAFAALAHPHRLGVLRLLMRHYPRRLPAGEIGAALDLRPSTLSGYLAQLMEAGLITQERHGTSLHYAASVEGAAALSATWLGEVCGGRGWPTGWTPGRRVHNLLFVGAGNCGPTLIAETLLRQSAGEVFEVFSAGLAPQPGAETATLAFLANREHDTAALWAKPLSTWQGADAPPMDVIVTLGARAAVALSDWPGCPHRAAWRLAADQSLAALHDDLAARIASFCGLDPALTPPSALQRALDGAAFS